MRIFHEMHGVGAPRPAPRCGGSPWGGAPLLLASSEPAGVSCAAPAPALLLAAVVGAFVLLPLAA